MSAPVQYDTFWTNVIRQSNYSVKEVASVLNRGDSTLRNYLTGNSMPSNTTIQAICDLFGIEFTEGKRQFATAFDAYHSDAKSTKTVSTKKKSKEVVAKQPKLDEATLDLVLSNIYNKVDYDTYKQISSILRG